MSLTEKTLVLLGVIFILQKLAPYFQRKLRENLTAVEDISLLGQPRKEGRKIQGTAVICGGSISGLLSARVCSDHFEKVIIVEPEGWLATEEGQRDRHRENFIPGSSAPKRSRIIQYTSIHVYQIFTTLALRKLFPDFDVEIERAGGRILPSISQYHVCGVPFVGPFCEPTDGIPTSLHATRPAYETGLRKLVLNHCSNVKYVVGNVTGLVPNTAENVIASVTVHTHSKDDDTAMEIPATMVVDCTGSAQGGLRWLQDMRSQAPFSSSVDKPESLDHLKVTYDSKVSYTTCEFNIPPHLVEKVKDICLPRDYEKQGILFTAITVPVLDPRVVTIQRRDRNYLQVMCGGLGFRGKITSAADIRIFLSKRPVSKPYPAFVNALLEFLDENEVPVTYVHPRISPSQYVQYYRAPQLPSNFVAVGDSVLQLNPVRGQGCTSACVDAVTLNALLARTTPVPSHDSYGETMSLPKYFGRNFFSVQSRRTGGVWDTLKPIDYSWSSTVPQPGDDINSWGNKFKRWHSLQLLELVTKDVQLARTLMGIEHYLLPSTDLLLPAVWGKIALLQLKKIIGIRNPFSATDVSSQGQ